MFARLRQAIRSTIPAIAVSSTETAPSSESSTGEVLTEVPAIVQYLADRDPAHRRAGLPAPDGL